MKFDRARADDLLEHLRAGLPYDNAVRLSSIEPGTARDWRKRKRFEAEVQDALAEGEARLLLMVVRAGQDNWRAAAWVLERAYPEKYGEARLGADDDSPEQPQSGLGAL